MDPMGYATATSHFWFQLFFEIAVAWQLFLLIEAGVNDLTLQFFDNMTRVATLTAGDDHCIGLCHFALEDWRSVV